MKHQLVYSTCHGWTNHNSISSQWESQNFNVLPSDSLQGMGLCIQYSLCRLSHLVMDLVLKHCVCTFDNKAESVLQRARVLFLHRKIGFASYLSEHLHFLSLKCFNVR